MRRVKQAVNGSEAKVTSFKLSGEFSLEAHLSCRVIRKLNRLCTRLASRAHSVRSYRANEVSSDDLIDQLWNIFDQNQEIAGPIIQGLADLFVQEDPEKRTSLLSAWEGLRAEVSSSTFFFSLPRVRRS